MKKQLFLLIVVAAILAPTILEAKEDKPLPFSFTAPHVYLNSRGDVQIQFYKSIPAQVIIAKRNSKTGRYTVVYNKVIQPIGNVRIYDSNRVKGDVYYTQLMYCLPLTEIPSRHCFYTQQYGPFEPRSYYWSGWPK